MAELTHLRLERPAAGVALLVLDNPDLRNAMSDEMTASWVAAIDELAADPTVRAVVVTGEGTAFCSGGDTSWIASEPDASVDGLRTRMIAFYRAWLSIRRLEVPTIAAINGAPSAPGCASRWRATCATPTARAKLGVPFVKLGMHPGMAGTYSLPDVVGEAARPRPAAHRPGGRRRRGAGLGLVSRVIEPEPFLDEVLETAAGIAATAPIASRLTKLALRRRRHADFEAALQWEAMAQPITLATSDLQEGIRASREKRAPVFDGR